MKLGFVLAACALAAGCGASGGDGNGPYCGDGVQQAGEQCDDGTSNGIPGDPCSATCTMVDTGCGDGVLESGEECDDGSRNGAPPAECSASCKLNDPTVTVDWKITDLDGNEGACPGWPASATDPEPVPSSIRLVAIASATPANCSGPDYKDCTLATFDCNDGSGSVRLPPGHYSLMLQPVQATDVYQATGPAPLDVTSSQPVQPVSFGANGGLQQGTMLAVSWTVSPDVVATCQSLQIQAMSTDDLGHATSWHAITEPCQDGNALLGPYLPGSYTVSVTEEPSGTATSPTNQVQIERSNMGSVPVDPIAVTIP